MVKKVMWPLLASILLLVLAGIVMAADPTVTIITPTSGSYLRGATHAWNVTVVGNNSPVTRVVLQRSTSQSSGFTEVAQDTTASRGGTTYWYASTINSKGLVDGTTYYVRAIAVNSSKNKTTSATAVGINNSIPKISTCLINSATAADTDISGSENTFACTVKNATSCTVTWLGSSRSAASSTSYSSCSFTYSSSYNAAGTSATCTLTSAKDGANTVVMACTDGLDTTTGTTYTMTLGGYSNAQRAQIPGLGPSGMTGARKDAKPILLGFIGLMVIVLVIVVLSKKKR